MKPWPKMQFCEVARVVTGNTPPRAESENYGGSIPWVKPPDLDTPEPITRTSEFLTEQGAKKARLLPKGSVMVGCIGRVGIVGIAGTECATNQQINSLVFGSKVLPKFGYYACVYLAPVIKARAGQAVLPLLNKGDFEQLEMPVPDLREQARIVELLDQADALRRQRAEADAKLARLLPALFRDHFGDPLADQPATSLREALIELKNGTTAAQNEDGKGYRVTRIETISAGTIDLGRTRFAEIDPDDLPAWRLIEGDILFSHINSETHLGKTALVPALAEPLIHGMNLLLLRPDRAKVTPEFLHTLLCTPAARSFWRTRCRRAVNQASINQGDLNALKFHRPALEKQIEFTRHAIQASEALAQAAASAAKLETLFQTLLHRAFTGELTARWREAHLREGVQELSRLSRA